MKPWKTPMNGWRSARAIGRVAKSLRARRCGFKEVASLRLGGCGVGVGGRARNRRHDARRRLARLAGLRRLDEELRLLDALRSELGRDALGGARVAIEQVAPERALREAIEEPL